MRDRKDWRLLYNRKQVFVDAPPLLVEVEGGDTDGAPLNLEGFVQVRVHLSVEQNPLGVLVLRSFRAYVLKVREKLV